MKHIGAGVAAWLVGTSLVAPAEPTALLTPRSFFTAKMIPKVGDSVRVGVTLPDDLPTPATVELRDACPERSATVVGRQTVKSLPRNGPPEAGFLWSPHENDWHTLTFMVTLPASARKLFSGTSLSVRTPVTTRDLYFAWFGSPLRFKWCNVPTTVKSAEEEREWLRRGAWPCHWRGGVCYKGWSRKRYAASYSTDRCIAIDEVGGPGAVTDKIIDAIREVKKRRPGSFVAVWYMGAHAYWADVRDVVDLFLPEIYLNYRGNHLGTFAPYLRTARATGVMDKCVPGLGINVIEDKKTGYVRARPTKADVLRQIQYLKRTAPDWPGVGFFTSYSAAPGVAEYADQLCETYYLDPVLRLSRLTAGGKKPAGGKSLMLCTKVRNVGETPARQVRWDARWVDSPAESPPLATGVIARLSPGENASVNVRLPAVKGVRCVRVQLQPQPHVTLLDGQQTRVVASLPQLRTSGAALLALPPADYDRTDLLVNTPFHTGGWRVTEIDGTGRRIRGIPAVCRAEVPGSRRSRLQFVVPGTTRKHRRRTFLVEPSGPERAAAPLTEGRILRGRLHVSGKGYVAELDCTADALVSLKAGEGETELLRRPWTFRAPGHETAARAVVTDTPVGREVVIPFESPEAAGVSRYTFYKDCPVIEIARVYTPRTPLSISGASEGASFTQRGGVFALQAGVGGVVRRGGLHDSSAYRDLLFGYLGEPPRPDNATKVGWFDFSWPAEFQAGLGVTLARRWRDAATKSYDVTRYYDAADWIQVNYVWGVNTMIDRRQESLVYLVPHGFVDCSRPRVVPPAQALWKSLQDGVEEAVQ